jgi:hypothetical protein
MNNTIQNIVIIPVTIVICLLQSKVEDFGFKRGTITCIAGQVIIYFYLRVDFPMSPYIVFLCTFCQSLL